MNAILMSNEGQYSAITTTLGDEAVVAAARLGEFLSCKVTVEKCTDIPGDHDWKQFRLPKKHHAAARVYLAAWNQGRLDGLDLHYGRDHFGSAGHVLKEASEQDVPAIQP